MTGKVIPFPSPGVQRIRIEPVSRPDGSTVWMVLCGCGHHARYSDRGDARIARRAHQVAHRKAREAHPAGRARPTGGDPA